MAVGCKENLPQGGTNTTGIGESPSARLRLNSRLESRGLPEEKAKSLLEYKPSQKIEKNGDEYTFTVYTKNGDKVFKAKSGVEFADTFRDLPVIKDSLPEEKAKSLLEYKPSQKIEKNGDEYTFTVYTKNGDKVFKAKSGVEFADTFRDLPVIKDSLPEEKAKSLLEYKPSQKIEKNGDEYTFTVYTKNGDKVFKAKSGVEFADTFRDLPVIKDSLPEEKAKSLLEYKPSQKIEKNGDEYTFTVYTKNGDKVFKAKSGVEFADTFRDLPVIKDSLPEEKAKSLLEYKPSQKIEKNGDEYTFTVYTKNGDKVFKAKSGVEFADTFRDLPVIKDSLPEEKAKSLLEYKPSQKIEKNGDEYTFTVYTKNGDKVFKAKSGVEFADTFRDLPVIKDSLPEEKAKSLLEYKPSQKIEKNGDEYTFTVYTKNGDKVFKAKSGVEFADTFRDLPVIKDSLPEEKAKSLLEYKPSQKIEKNGDEYTFTVYTKNGDKVFKAKSGVEFADTFRDLPVIKDSLPEEKAKSLLEYKPSQKIEKNGDEYTFTVYTKNGDKVFKAKSGVEFADTFRDLPVIKDSLPEEKAKSLLEYKPSQKIEKNGDEYTFTVYTKNGDKVFKAKSGVEFADTFRDLPVIKDSLPEEKAKSLLEYKPSQKIEKNGDEYTFTVYTKNGDKVFKAKSGVEFADTFRDLPVIKDSLPEEKAKSLLEYKPSQKIEKNGDEYTFTVYTKNGDKVFKAKSGVEFADTFRDLPVIKDSLPEEKAKSLLEYKPSQKIEKNGDEYTFTVYTKNGDKVFKAKSGVEFADTFRDLPVIKDSLPEEKAKSLLEYKPSQKIEKNGDEYTFTVYTKNGDKVFKAKSGVEFADTFRDLPVIKDSLPEEKAKSLLEYKPSQKIEKNGDEYTFTVYTKNGDKVFKAKSGVEFADTFRDLPVIKDSLPEEKAKSLLEYKPSQKIEKNGDEYTFTVYTKNGDKVFKAKSGVEFADTFRDLPVIKDSLPEEKAKSLLEYKPSQKIEKNGDEYTFTVYTKNGDKVFKAKSGVEFADTFRDLPVIKDSLPEEKAKSLLEYKPSQKIEKNGDEYTFTVYTKNGDKVFKAKSGVEFADTFRDLPVIKDSLPEEKAKSLLEYKPSQKIEKNGDEYTFTVYTKNGDKVFKAKSGVEFADTFRDLPVIKDSLPEEKAKSLLEYKPSQKIEKNGDEYTFTVYTKNGDKVFKAKSGVEFADTFRDLPVIKDSLPEEKAKSLLEYKPSQKIEKNGDEYTFTVYTKNGDKVFKAKSGVEFADTFRDLPVKITFNVDGNKVTQIIKFDIGFTLTIKKEYSHDTLNEEISHSLWDGVAKKVYKAL
ncbi:Fatty acid-binding protein 2 [Papilio xuthus]|uniref:Fatty acid-binding protein 2 n=1 Tax=Papilio xuthus TaxID=66420 RepID=A0A0N1IQI6_PAPXU|nr:Fatty acid-binding protein 2 [Papilio xuthus]